MGKFRQGFMNFVWRQQQVQAIAGIFLWTISLTGIFYPYLESDIKRTFNVGVLGGMGVFFVILIGAVFLSGAVYDRFLKMWRFQSIVTTMKTPYSRGKLSAAMIFQYLVLRIKLLESLGREDDANFLRKWVLVNLVEDREACCILDELCLKNSGKDAKYWLEFNGIDIPPGIVALEDVACEAKPDESP